MLKRLLFLPLLIFVLLADGANRGVTACLATDCESDSNKTKANAPSALEPKAPFSPFDDTRKMQVLRPAVPPSTTIQVQRPVPPTASKSISVKTNTCATAFNNLCDEPNTCEVGTDSHDCAPEAKP